MQLRCWRILLPSLLSPLLIASGVPSSNEQNLVFLSDLEMGPVVQEYAIPLRGRSVDGHVLSIGGKRFSEGVGSHAPARWDIDLKGKGSRFRATVGVDDETKGQGSVEFLVFVNGKLAARSGVLRSGTAQSLEVGLIGASTLSLQISNGGDGGNDDHADWCDASIEMVDKTVPTGIWPRRSSKDPTYIYPMESGGDPLPNWAWRDLPITFVVMADDDGTNGPEFLPEMVPCTLKELNRIFAPTHLRFTWDQSTGWARVNRTRANRAFIPDSGIYQNRNQEPPKREWPRDPGGSDPYINIYPHSIPIIVRRGSSWGWDDRLGRWVDNPAGGGVGGATVCIDGTPDASLLAHELGHSLGLGHTFGPRPSSIAEAAQLISDAIRKGMSPDKAANVFRDDDVDHVFDIRPDPDQEVFGSREEFRAYPRIDVKVNLPQGGARIYTLAPDPFNTMSYYPESGSRHPQTHEFMGHFTEDQYRCLRFCAEEWLDDTQTIPPLSKPPGARVEFETMPVVAATKNAFQRVFLDRDADFKGNDYRWGGKAVLLRGKTSDQVSFKIPGATSSERSIWWSGTYGPNHGNAEISLNGEPIGTISQWGIRECQTGWRKLSGQVKLGAKNVLTIRVIGHEKNAKGQKITLDALCFGAPDKAP